MGGSNFNQIAQAILEQQQHMLLLQQENNELRKQLADIRAGRGLVIDICGLRFTTLDQPGSDVQAEEEVPQILEPAPVLDEEILPDTPTAIRVKVPRIDDESDIFEEPVEPDEQTAATATFLEEIMLDEFSSAMSNPLSTWIGPDQAEQARKTQRLDARPEDLDEEQKAALRRELIGSFLLE